MPLFVDASGEGIYVAPKPHRSSASVLGKAEKLKRLARHLLWHRLHNDGLTFETIAELVERPASTIKDGVRNAEKYHAKRAEREAKEISHLTPIFGVLPLTPSRQDSFERRGHCEICGAHLKGVNKTARSTVESETGRVVAGVAHQGLACGGCGCVSPEIQARFDHEIAQDRIEEMKLATNRRGISEVPESHYEAIQAQLDQEREPAPKVTPTYKSALIDHLTESPVS